MASSSPKTPVSSGVISTLLRLMRSTARPNSSWKRKGPAHFDFLGHYHVLRDRNVAAEAELNQDAARLEHLQPRANRAFVAGRFKLNIEIPLVGGIVAKL